MIFMFISLAYPFFIRMRGKRQTKKSASKSKASKKYKKASKKRAVVGFSIHARKKPCE